MGHTEVMLSSGIFSIRLEGVFCKKKLSHLVIRKSWQFQQDMVRSITNIFSKENVIRIVCKIGEYGSRIVKK
jgi:hypothetical protein